MVPPHAPLPFLLGALVLLVSPALAAQGPALPLWASVDGPPPALEQPELRGRTVALVEVEALLAEARGRFELELFDGQRLEVDLELLSRPRPGSAVWYGELGPAGSGDHLLLATTEGAAAATLQLGERLLRLRGAAGALVLSELDPSGFQPCGTGPAQAVPGRPHDRPLEPHAGDAGVGRLPLSSGAHTIDVLTLWTPQTRVGVGGLAAMLALVDLAIAETNLSLSNCDALARVRLVHAAETDYVESGSTGTELSRLRSASDGHMDEAHALRNAYGADVVALLTHTGDYCGMAYLMTNVGSSFASSAFSVTKRSCATGNYTFGHELGHNFGCAHDPDNAGNASRPWAYGYRTPNNQLRTVMAYSPGSRRPIFSSPLHTWNGMVMGVDGSQDNARAISQNAPTIAAWRATVIPEPGWYNYCLRLPNSVGPGASLWLAGSLGVAANDLLLGAVGAVPGQFGLFFYGPSEVQQPFGDGLICVGPGSIGTFRLSPVEAVDSTTVLVRPLDLAAPPAGSGPGAIAAGSIWKFQLWYRDPAGPGASGFNLSDALSVTFGP